MFDVQYTTEKARRDYGSYASEILEGQQTTQEDAHTHLNETFHVDRNHFITVVATYNASGFVSTKIRGVVCRPAIFTLFAIVVGKDSKCYTGQCRTMYKLGHF
jgi:hypothetical protein